MTDTAPTQATTGVPFTLNGQDLEAKQGELLIDAAERNGVHIPRFCYHPRMKSVGMCRMCLVEVDGGRGPSLQPSCMLTVTPDMKVNTESETTKAAQDGVLELTLINHPLDCPVCDKGGECPLQDNAFAFGPGESRFVEEKRHYEKPIPISDLVFLDRERCILCDRCTRFADEVAGDPLIHFIDRGNQTQVNTFPGLPFSSYFSGNTVQICPVGALTSKPYRFAARPWDLAENESTSAVDSTGARIVLQSSQDRLVRVLGVDSEAVNWSWLSDKERFAYEATNAEARLHDPMMVKDGSLETVRWNTALSATVAKLALAPSQIGVLGGARLSVESQYAWAKVLKGLAGIDNIDAQLGDGLPAHALMALPRATIAEAAQPGGVIVLLGVDPKEDLPTLFLRLRHAVVEDGASLIEITPRPTGLSEFASSRIYPQPGSLGVVTQALSAGMVGTSLAGIEASELTTALELLNSGRPVTVVVGRGNLAEKDGYTVAALSALRSGFGEAKFLSGLRRGNVHGALEMGLTPGQMPGGRPLEVELDGWISAPAERGLDAEGILRAAAAGEIATLVLLGSDPLTDYPDRALVREAFDNVDTIISVDAFLTESSQRAQILLPTTLMGESDGTFCNLENRLSPLRAKVTGPGQARDDWMIAAEVAAAAGGDLGFSSIDEIRAEISDQVPTFADIDWAEVDASGDGPLLAPSPRLGADLGESASDFSAPATGGGDGLRLVVDRKMWDLGTMVNESASQSQLRTETYAGLSPVDADRMAVDAGDLVVVTTGDHQVSLAVKIEAGLPTGTIHIPFRLPGFDPGEAISAAFPVSEVEVTK